VASPIDAADFERSRTAFVVSERSALEGFAARSERIADEMATTGDLANLRNPAFDDVTAADVERVMRRILVDADASVAIVRPGARGDYPAVLEEASGTPQPLEVAERAPVAIPVLKAGEPAAATLPSRETAALSNGIKVVHYRMAGAPMAYLSAVVSGGTNNDPRGKEGLYDLAIQMGTHGAAGRNEEEFAEAMRDVGGGVGAWMGMTSSGAILSVVPENLAAGVELLADVIQAPRFDAEPWAVLKAGTRQYLAQRDVDPDSVASRALNRIIYTPGPDDSEIDTSLASIESITIEEAAAAYRTLFVPATMVIYSVSDLPIKAVVAALEPRLGKWQEAGKGVTAKPPLQPAFPERRRVYVVPVPGASQATIHISRPAPGRDDQDYPDAIAVTNLLAGDFTSRLNAVIREQKGYSYGVGAYLWSWLDHEGGVTVTIPVQSDATGAALTEALAGFDSLVSTPVSEAELGRSLMSYLTAQAGLPETAGGFFGALVSWEKDGVELDSLVTFLKRMSALDLGDVRKVGATLAGLERAVIVIAGDPGTILPQLAAIGITDAETIDIAAR
jgi:predicted Zn-dependent peptidase